MLQQTQVETALPYYERFIREFPSVHDLARADESRVLTLWAGLGYYRRAKNLMAAARIVATEHGGRIPCDYDKLIGLPGVGQYMAGAILSAGAIVSDAFSTPRSRYAARCRSEYAPASIFSSVGSSSSSHDCCSDSRG